MHGETSIQTTEHAAAVLKPIAGDLAFALFSIGIIDAGMLALPILAGSVAFAVSDMFGCRIANIPNCYGESFPSRLSRHLRDRSLTPASVELLFSWIGLGISAFPMSAPCK